MHLIGPARLGADAIVRFTPEGKPVANLSLAFNYVQKNGEGKRPTQWVDASLWGERAQKLAPYLLKGVQIDVHLADPHLETFVMRDGTQGTKIVAMVNHLEFVGSAPQSQQQGQAQPATREQNRERQRAALDAARQQSGQRPAASNFSDMDDDIPFALDAGWCRVDPTSKQLLRAKHGRGMALMHANEFDC